MNVSEARRADQRVVVTGMGAVSAWGWGVGPLWEGLQSAVTAIRPFDRFDHARQRSHVAGQVPEGPPSSFARPRGWNRLAYSDRFALFAAQEAALEARLDVPLTDAGLYFASSTGGMLESEWFFEELVRTRGERARRGLVASQQLNAPGDAVARHLGISGPVQTVSSACASGGLAIEAALMALRSGEVERALAGGSDSLCQITYSGFNSLRAVDEGPCRPFREGRAGMSLGEGAAVLVLETLEGARARGAKPVAELLGAGSSCDANHMTAPHPEGIGAALALSRALADARIEPMAVGFINAHGTGTPLNDAAEWAAFERALGSRAGEVPVTSSKGAVGHLLGSAGCLEAVATILCLQAREVHPTAGEGPVDPTIPVRLVDARPASLNGAEVGVSTSLAFGGANVALVLSRWTD